MSRVLLAGIVALSLVGCASVPKTAPELDLAAKTFTPAEGKAALYIVRPNSALGAAVALPVNIDGRELGSTARGTYLMLEVEPGKHTISSKTLENSKVVEVTAEAGKSYFFVIKPRMGLIAARAGLEPVTEEEGRAEVMKAKRAQNAF